MVGPVQLKPTAVEQAPLRRPRRRPLPMGGQAARRPQALRLHRGQLQPARHRRTILQTLPRLPRRRRPHRVQPVRQVPQPGRQHRPARQRLRVRTNHDRLRGKH